MNDAIGVLCFFRASSEEGCNTCIKRRRCRVTRRFTRCETSVREGRRRDENEDEDGWIDAFSIDS